MPPRDNVQLAGGKHIFNELIKTYTNPAHVFMQKTAIINKNFASGVS